MPLQGADLPIYSRSRIAIVGALGPQQAGGCPDRRGYPAPRPSLPCAAPICARLRGGRGGGARRGARARSSTPFCGALGGGRGLRLLFGSDPLRRFHAPRRLRSTTLLGGAVAKVEEDVYDHHHQEHAEYGDRRVEGVEEPVHLRPPPCSLKTPPEVSPAVAGCATGSARPLSRHPSCSGRAS